MTKKEQPTRKSHRCGRVVWFCLAVAWIVATVGSCLFLDSMVSRRLWDHPVHWHKNDWVNGFRQLGRAGVPIWLLAVWSCLTGKWRPTFVVIAAMVLVGVNVCPLKALVRRTRPIHVLPVATGQPQPELSWQKKVSFPSGDTAVAFAAATVLSLSWGSLWAPALFVMATAIGVLRVTAFAHYPSDVMAGAMIGVLCGVVALRWTRCWRSLDEFRLKGYWRLVVALALIFVLPIVAPYIGNGPALSIFLKKYAIPLLVLIVLHLALVWLRRQKPEAGEDALDDERSEPLS